MMIIRLALVLSLLAVQAAVSSGFTSTAYVPRRAVQFAPPPRSAATNGGRRRRYGTATEARTPLREAVTLYADASATASTTPPFANSTSATASERLGAIGPATPGGATEEDRKSPLLVLWKFTRPHTLVGSALAIPALHLLAAPTLGAAFTMRNTISCFYAMIPSLLMNIYITGLNQITDVEIDKINKPDLPIAAGDLSPAVATVVVLSCLIISLGMGLSNPSLGTQGLNVALWGSGILGTAYSLEPFRLKRFPLLAAFCIVAVRGTIINAGFFAHAQSAAFGGVATTSVLGCLLNDPKCLLSSIFFGVFGIVIALMKDVPDVGGDEKFNIRSFSVRVGQKRVFTAMRRLLVGLFLSFGAGFLRGAFRAPSAFIVACRTGVGMAALAMGWSTRERASDVDPKDSTQVYNYYMHLWKLFYICYLVLPFAR